MYIYVYIYLYTYNCAKYLKNLPHSLFHPEGMCELLLCPSRKLGHVGD